MSKKNSRTHTRTLVEGALMIALSTVLSTIQIPLMPHGGSITLFSMLPILVVSYRHGTTWGLMTAFVNSLIQLVQGLGNLAYCQTLGAQIGCILLDYLLAFSVLGLANTFSPPLEKRTGSIALGCTTVCLLRFVCSVLSGYVVWKDYDYAFEWLNNFSWGAWFTATMGENALCWAYSLIYNATYMLPETILTVVGAAVAARMYPQLFQQQNG